MSSQLVRLFTCASVISLAGFTTVISVSACSSDATATPEGDDDDDTKGDDDDTTTTKKDAGSTSSSTSSSSSGGQVECNPIGTYELGKPTYTVTTPGSVCDDFAKSGQTNGQPTEVVITKEGATYKAVVGPSSLLLAAADEGCQIGGGITPVGYDAKDGDGKAITAKLVPTQFYDFDGDKVVSKVNYHIVSDPEGAKGTPCDMSQTAAGTRKK